MSSTPWWGLRIPVNRSVSSKRNALPRLGLRYLTSRLYTTKYDRIGRVVSHCHQTDLVVRNPEMKPLLHKGKARR